ncbi:MAG: hypothetical protein KIS62_12350 [Ramlibacter sp.]|nr:hypothetical protein [Ramlibacter sp.]MCW5650529.1 hypothetical protein [Ramlibacter sp.]
MSEPTTVDVAVMQRTGTYQTAAVNGVKASCTAGEKQAAERFGQKYFGPAYTGVQLVEASAAFKPAVWRVNADPKAYAWCYATGLIEIHDTMPVDKPDGSGPVAFASGPRRALEESLSVLARHGQGASKGKLIAPGVPEAKNQKDAMTTLILWVNACALRNGQAKQHGVVYGRERDVL